MQQNTWWGGLFTAAVILLLMASRGFEALLFLGAVGIIGAVRVYRGNTNKRLALMSAAAAVVAISAAVGIRFITHTG
jgi:hypothetical protein